MAGLAIALGGWLRLSGLDAKSIIHTEVYVPGIRLPEGVSQPRERLTAAKVLTGTFSSDTHPPGYYLMMLPWTRITGTSLRAIRLPSALLGTASIGLVYALGALIGASGSGAVAAALLAFSGPHVFWSKVARMFALACFLGLASTMLLLLIARGSRHRRILITLYVTVILAGVASHHFFWSILATQMIWAFGNAWGRVELPDVCRAQLLGLVLGSPLIAFSAYQSGTTVAPLSNSALIFLAGFISFAYALPTSRSGFFPSAVPFTGTAISWAVRGMIGLVGAFLFVLGLRNLWRRPSNNRIFPEPSSAPRFWNFIWIIAGIAATLEIIFFVYMTRYLDEVHNTIKMTKVLSVMPLTLTAAALLLNAKWASLPPAGSWKRFVSGERALIALMAIGPFVLLSAFSQFRPLLNERGLLFVAPFLLLVLAVGLFELRRKIWIALLLPALALICAASVVSYRPMTGSPGDYGQLAAAVKAEIQTGDLVFIQKEWYTTPVLYYLYNEHYQLVGRSPEEYAQACALNPAAQVWVVLPHDSEASDAMRKALADYKLIRIVAVPHGKAILYKRISNAAQTVRP
jgi:hypothetical protein